MICKKQKYQYHFNSKPENKRRKVAFFQWKVALIVRTVTMHQYGLIKGKLLFSPELISARKTWAVVVRRWPVKKTFQKVSQNQQEDTRAGIFPLTMSQAVGLQPQILLKRLWNRRLPASSTKPPRIPPPNP